MGEAVLPGAWLTQSLLCHWKSHGSLGDSSKLLPLEDEQAAPLTVAHWPLSSDCFKAFCNNFQKLPETFELCSFSEPGKGRLLLESYVASPP